MISLVEIFGRRPKGPDPQAQGKCQYRGDSLPPKLRKMMEEAQSNINDYMLVLPKNFPAAHRSQDVEFEFYSPRALHCHPELDAKGLVPFGYDDETQMHYYVDVTKPSGPVYVIFHDVPQDVAHLKQGFPSLGAFLSSIRVQRR